MNDKHLDLISDRVTPLLKDCFIEDIRTSEVGNISSRIIKIIEDSLIDVDNSDKNVTANLKKLFIKRARELNDKLTITIHEKESENQIEAIVHPAIKTILDGELFAEDDEWLNTYVEGQVNQFIYALIKHYFEMLFQKTEFAMLRSWDDAELHTFGKEKPRFRMSELDRILKSGVGFNAWLDTADNLKKLAEDYAVTHEGVIIEKLIDGMKLCDWDAGFREYCLEKYGEK